MIKMDIKQLLFHNIIGTKTPVLKWILKSPDHYPTVTLWAEELERAMAHQRPSNKEL